MGSCQSLTIAVGGLLKMKNNSWLINNLNIVNCNSKWRYRLIKINIINNQVISPKLHFFIKVKGKNGVTNEDFTIIDAIYK